MSLYLFDLRHRSFSGQGALAKHWGMESGFGMVNRTGIR